MYTFVYIVLHGKVMNERGFKKSVRKSAPAIRSEGPTGRGSVSFPALSTVPASATATGNRFSSADVNCRKLNRKSLEMAPVSDYPRVGLIKGVLLTAFIYSFQVRDPSSATPNPAGKASRGTRNSPGTGGSIPD